MTLMILDIVKTTVFDDDVHADDDLNVVPQF